MKESDKFEISFYKKGSKVSYRIYSKIHEYTYESPISFVAKTMAKGHAQKMLIEFLGGDVKKQFLRACRNGSVDRSVRTTPAFELVFGFLKEDSKDKTFREIISNLDREDIKNIMISWLFQEKIYMDNTWSELL